MGNQIMHAFYRLAHRFDWHHSRTFWVGTDRHTYCPHCGLHDLTKFDKLKMEYWGPVKLKDIENYPAK